MNRRRRSFRSLSFELLEDRRLLAGDVTAQIIRGDLVIHGDHADNGITITAGTAAGTVVITGVNAGGAATSGRRLALARWLTADETPASALVARVMVNRLWGHVFGRGLVSTAGNFGRSGQPPTHPELLEWLAGEFIAGGWRVKPMIRLLMTSTTGEDALYCVLDEKLRPVPAEMPAPVRAVVERIGENCEPSLCTVLFMAGAGGSLRAGVTENPVLLTRSVARGETRVTMGGAPVYVWPGGGITLMVDVMRVPEGAFGYVPTPALVAPIEFTLRRDDYVRLGGYEAEIRTVEDVLAKGGEYHNERHTAFAARKNPWPPLAQLHRAGPA